LLPEVQKLSYKGITEKTLKSLHAVSGAFFNPLFKGIVRILPMKVCIVGGGLTGLAAAWRLKDRHDIDIYEKNSQLGGCLSSYNIDDYWIEQFYHHCFAGDRHLLALISDLKLSDKLEWLRGTTGYFVQDTVYPLNTPLEILAYPYLSLPEKVRLALLTLRSRNMDPADLDTITARDFIVRELGERVYDSFFEPLLRSKFGPLLDEVSAAWLIGRISIRSNRGLAGERLGYLKGGFHTFIEALADAVGHDCTVRTRDPVISLRREDRGWRVNDQRYDAVLSTVPPQALRKAGGPDLPFVPYQGAACLALGLDAEYTKGVYWLNMKDPAPFGAVVTHTNFAPYERYGEHIVYLASYFSGELPAQAGKVMKEAFLRIFGVPDSSIHWEKLAVEPLAGPVFTTGYRKSIPGWQAAGIFWAGMFSLTNYPERSMDGSIAAGYAGADAIERSEAGP
jgi:protoporphyrinogen oxidase